MGLASLCAMDWIWGSVSGPACWLHKTGPDFLGQLLNGLGLDLDLDRVSMKTQYGTLLSKLIMYIICETMFISNFFLKKKNPCVFRPAVKNLTRSYHIFPLFLSFRESALIWNSLQLECELLLYWSHVNATYYSIDIN